jgi:hypothetical protein
MIIGHAVIAIIGQFRNQNRSQKFFERVSELSCFLCRPHKFDFKTGVRFLFSADYTSLLSWVQSIEPVLVSGHLEHHRMGYTNQAQNKPSARDKKDIEEIRKILHTYEALHQSTSSKDFVTRRTNINTTSPLNFVGCSSLFLLLQWQSRWERRPSCIY